MRKISLIFTVLLLGFLALPSVSWGVMSSTNYTIFADSIDSGGVLSTGGAYSLEDTVGESPVGSSTSTTYEVIGGYQAMDWSVLTISLDTNAIDLGALSVSAVTSLPVAVYVTADADTGYVLSVGGISGTSLLAVTDGSVTAGQEEYGVAVSGGDASFSDDRAIAVGLNLASSSTPVVGAQTTLTFKASRANASTPGTRSQSVTLTASTNI